MKGNKKGKGGGNRTGAYKPGNTIRIIEIIIIQ